MLTEPSHIHPDLTKERINVIGQLIARVREENLNAADYRDNGWSIGCRAYSWICSELVNLAKSKQYDWLKIVDNSLKFVFTIGNAEVSFYKGAPSKPKKNIYNRAQHYPELRQIPMFNNSNTPPKLIWAFAIETDYEGQTTNIEFFGITEVGEILSSHQVPFNSAGSKLVALNNSDEAAVELPSAPIKLPRVNRDNQNTNEKK